MKQLEHPTVSFAVIFRCSLDDSAEYSVEVKNAYGEANSFATVFVRSKSRLDLDKCRNILRSQMFSAWNIFLPQMHCCNTSNAGFNAWEVFPIVFWAISITHPLIQTLPIFFSSSRHVGKRFPARCGRREGSPTPGKHLVEGGCQFGHPLLFYICFMQRVFLQARSAQSGFCLKEKKTNKKAWWRLELGFHQVWCSCSSSETHHFWFRYGFFCIATWNYLAPVSNLAGNEV